MYKVSFYIPLGKTSPIERFLESFNPKQEAKVTKALNYIKEFGLTRSIPNLRKLTGTPLWELRILGKDNIRVVCIPLNPKEIMVLHIFVKKKRKTPINELKVAINRYKTVIDI